MKINKKNIFITTAIALVALIVIAVVGKDVIITDTFTLQSSDFESTIITQGQIKSQEYHKINLPSIFSDQQLNIYYLRINDLVAEGTKVEKGDFVALLDQEQIKTEINRAQDRQLNYENYVNMSKIDSAADLTKRRNNIREMEYNLEYKILEIKQSIYESASYQDKVKREYSRAQRKLDMTKRDYTRSQLSHSKKCVYNQHELTEITEKLEKLKHALAASRITAPTDGMLIYAKVRGRTIKKDSRVAPWSPEIAVIPNLNKLVSETYIEEVDVQKVKIGSTVRIKVDALPNKEFTGEVVSFSNIGKSMKGLDSKVFDISIKVNGYANDIAHNMNTTNEIIVMSKSNVLTVPLQYIYSTNKGDVVYRKVNREFQETPISYTYSNEEVVLIDTGLDEGDILSFKPENK